MNDAPSQGPRRRTAVTSRRQRFAAVALTGSLLIISACGDDDPDTSATTVAAAPATSDAAPETTVAPSTTEAISATTAAPDTTASETTAEDPDAEYCDAAAEINSSDAAPTLEQFRAYAELAPEGIADTVGEVLEAYEGVDGELEALMGDEAFLESIDQIDSFENEYCGFESEESSSNSIPDDPFCVAALEIYNVDDFPTSEQLQAYADVAPDDIAEPVAVVLEKFEAAAGDFDALFSDPEFAAAIGELEDFEFEYCGIGDAPSPAMVIDPNATRVDVTATDYHFDFEVPTEAGRYSFVMNNGGEEAHIMILLQLEEGADLDAVIASEGEEGVVASFESDLAAPGGEAVITADLVAGDWVLLCPIPTAEDEPHFVLGMIHEFTIA